MSGSPSITPQSPDERDVYLVFDDFGEQLGRAWPEADEHRTDRATVIADLLDGQYSDPIRVVAFNTSQGWSRDASHELADIIAQECWDVGFDVPPFLEQFISRHATGRVRQLAFPFSAY
jgi:hypothetical protein